MDQRPRTRASCAARGLAEKGERGRSKHEDGRAQTWICGNLTHGRFCFSSCVLDRCERAVAKAAPRQMRPTLPVPLTLLRSWAYSPRLTPVPALSGVAVRSMSCGRAHTLLATEEGTVYSWYCLPVCVLPTPAVCACNL